MDLTDVCFAGAATQAELLRAGELSSRELVQACLSRIDDHDRRINAFRLVFAERALAEADQADQRRTRGEDAPLLGVPVAVKEDLALAGEPTTNGTDAMRAPALEDAEAVRRLRAAGAVLVGRTRMPELGLFPYTESGFGGATRNPWSTAHSAGGSSGGSAAAVAAGMVGAALGTDGAGSIRIPSACCGVFGLKPQAGRISLHPAGEVWTGMVATGPITRHVRDWALLVDHLHGALPTDRVVAHPPRTSFTVAANTDPPTLRVGLSLRPWGVGVSVDPVVRDAVLDTARLLADLGHEVVRRDPELVDPTSLLALAPRYLRSAAAGIAELEWPDRVDRRTRQVASMGRAIPDRVLARALRMGPTVAERANRVFRDVDVLLTPVLSWPTIRVGQWQNWSTLHAMVVANQYVGFLPLWNIAGNPAASVPAGHTHGGLPLAVQLVGRRHDECTLLALAGQLERVRPWADRRPPGVG